MHVWYNPFFGDGDSSAYATAAKSRPCGPVVFIQKECVNDVMKQMGSNLRKLVMESDKKAGIWLKDW